MSMSSTEVLIVGAGPVGLTCSILLSQLGVANRVIERREGLHLSPQAHVISGRSMEIFRAAGIDEVSLRAVASAPTDIMGIEWTHTLAGPSLGRLNLATPERAVKIFTLGPAPFANISQHRLEPILLQHAEKARAPVDFCHDWQSMESTANGVTSRVLDRASGEVEEIHSRFLLGCDGAGSSVRRASGIDLQGPTCLETWVNVHFKANLREVVGDRPAVLYWHLDPEEPGIFIAHDIDSTWVYMAPYNQDELTPEHFDEATCRGMIERAIGTDHPFEFISRATWTLSAEVAERYGDGSTWLLGDAAHRFPPSGGLGLNTGLADAFNLAWKVAAVCDKRAGINLLETYELERRDVAIANTRVSLANHHKMTEVVAALDVPAELDAAAAREQIRTLPATQERAARVQAAIDNQVEHFDTFGLDFGYSYARGAIVPDGTTHHEPANIVTDYVPCTRPGSRLPHAWVHKGGALISTLDLIDRRVPTLLTGDGGAAWRDAAEGLGIPVTMIGAYGAVQDPEGAWAAVREIADNGALLVRPDGHVGWRAMEPSADATTELRSALERILPTGDS